MPTVVATHSRAAGSPAPARRGHLARRLLAGTSAFIGLTGTVLILPVYAAPAPDPRPVPTAVQEVALGSVVDPTTQAVVATDGQVEPGGVSEAEAAGDPAPAGSSPDGAGASRAGGAEDAPVVSGDEVPGVPALTVDKPRTGTFESIGVTWTNDPAIEDVLVQVRLKDKDGRWGRWTQLQPDDVDQSGAGQPADGTVRDGTSPYWTGGSYGVQAVVQGANGATPRDVRVALLNPGTSSADDLESSTPTGTAHAAQAMPPVFSRAQWGADESIRTWDPEYAGTIKAATIHHTADTNDYTPDQVPAIMRAIYTYHAVTRGWGDIGYNVVVDKWGRIFEGRAGGLDSTVIGAHAGGFNTYTFGVSMLGNYDTTPVPQATVNAVAAIVAWKFSLYGVDPTGTTTLTSSGGGTSKYAAGVPVSLPTIFAHRDVGNTVCPGKYGYARMAEIRQRVSANFSAASLVNALYHDVLGRAPGSGELQGWTNAVATSGDRWVAVRGFSGSEEYRRIFVTQAYEDILGRDPEKAGLDGWVADMAAGRTTPDQLRTKLMLSQEFYLRGGGTDRGFVDLLYQRAFGRHASSSEQSLWAGTIASKGRAEAVRGIWDSLESALHRVDRSYQRWLGRPASPSEQEYWSRMVITKGDESMRESALVSAEYLARATARFP